MKLKLGSFWEDNKEDRGGGRGWGKGGGMRSRKKTKTTERTKLCFWIVYWPIRRLNDILNGNQKKK